MLLLFRFVVFAKRTDVNEARIRLFCMTDDREDKTLEHKELFTEVSNSRDVEVCRNIGVHDACRHDDTFFKVLFSRCLLSVRSRNFFRLDVKSASLLFCSFCSIENKKRLYNKNKSYKI